MKIYVNSITFNDHSEHSEKVKKICDMTSGAIIDAAKWVSDDSESVITAEYYKPDSSYSDENDYFKIVLSTFDSTSDESVKRKVKRRQIEAANNGAYCEIVLCPDFHQGEAVDESIAKLTIRVYYERLKSATIGGIDVTDNHRVANAIKDIFREKYD